MSIFNKTIQNNEFEQEQEPVETVQPEPVNYVEPDIELENDKKKKVVKTAATNLVEKPVEAEEDDTPSESDWADIEGRRLQVPRNFRKSIFNFESGGKQFYKNGKLVVSPKGAQGYTQIMPQTAKGEGFNNTKDNPYDNISAGMQYLRKNYDYWLKRSGGDKVKAWEMAARGYLNGREAAGQEKHDGNVWTRQYADRVMDGWAKNLDSGERDDDWNDPQFFHSYEKKAGRDYALKAGEEQQQGEFETGEPVVLDDEEAGVDSSDQQGTAVPDVKTEDDNKENHIKEQAAKIFGEAGQTVIEQYKQSRQTGRALDTEDFNKFLSEKSESFPISVQNLPSVKTQIGSGFNQMIKDIALKNNTKPDFNNPVITFGDVNEWIKNQNANRKQMPVPAPEIKTPFQGYEKDSLDGKKPLFVPESKATEALRGESSEEVLAKSLSIAGMSYASNPSLNTPEALRGLDDFYRMVGKDSSNTRPEELSELGLSYTRMLKRISQLAPTGKLEDTVRAATSELMNVIRNGGAEAINLPENAWIKKFAFQNNALTQILNQPENKDIHSAVFNSDLRELWDSGAKQHEANENFKRQIASGIIPSQSASGGLTYKTALNVSSIFAEAGYDPSEASKTVFTTIAKRLGFSDEEIAVSGVDKDPLENLGTGKRIETPEDIIGAGDYEEVGNTIISKVSMKSGQIERLMDARRAISLDFKSIEDYKAGSQNTFTNTMRQLAKDAIARMDEQNIQSGNVVANPDSSTLDKIGGTGMNVVGRVSAGLARGTALYNEVVLGVVDAGSMIAASARRDLANDKEANIASEAEYKGLDMQHERAKLLQPPPPKSNVNLARSGFFGKSLQFGGDIIEGAVTGMTQIPKYIFPVLIVPMNTVGKSHTGDVENLAWDIASDISGIVGGVWVNNSVKRLVNTEIPIASVLTKKFAEKLGIPESGRDKFQNILANLLRNPAAAQRGTKYLAYGTDTTANAGLMFGEIYARHHLNSQTRELYNKAAVIKRKSRDQWTPEEAETVRQLEEAQLEISAEGLGKAFGMALLMPMVSGGLKAHDYKVLNENKRLSVHNDLVYSTLRVDAEGNKTVEYSAPIRLESGKVEHLAIPSDNQLIKTAFRRNQVIAVDNITVDTKFAASRVQNRVKSADASEKLYKFAEQDIENQINIFGLADKEAVSKAMGEFTARNDETAIEYQGLKRQEANDLESLVNADYQKMIAGEKAKKDEISKIDAERDAIKQELRDSPEMDIKTQNQKLGKAIELDQRKEEIIKTIDTETGKAQETAIREGLDESGLDLRKITNPEAKTAVSRMVANNEAFIDSTGKLKPYTEDAAKAEAKNRLDTGEVISTRRIADAEIAMSRPDRVTAEDFEVMVKKGRFANIAGHIDGVDNYETGLVKTNALKKELQDAGLDVYDALGKYGEEQSSLFIRLKDENDEKTAFDLSAKYDQKQVLFGNRGEYYAPFSNNHDGKIKGVDENFSYKIASNVKADDYYTSVNLPDGSKFNYTVEDLYNGDGSLRKTNEGSLYHPNKTKEVEGNTVSKASDAPRIVSNTKEASLVGQTIKRRSDGKGITVDKEFSGTFKDSDGNLYQKADFILPEVKGKSNEVKETAELKGTDTVSSKDTQFSKDAESHASVIKEDGASFINETLSKAMDIVMSKHNNVKDTGGFEGVVLQKAEIPFVAKLLVDNGFEREARIVTAIADKLSDAKSVAFINLSRDKDAIKTVAHEVVHKVVGDYVDFSDDFISKIRGNDAINNFSAKIKAEAYRDLQDADLVQEILGHGLTSDSKGLGVSDKDLDTALKAVVKEISSHYKENTVEEIIKDVIKTTESISRKGQFDAEEVRAEVQSTIDKYNSVNDGKSFVSSEGIQDGGRIGLKRSSDKDAQQEQTIEIRRMTQSGNPYDFTKKAGREDSLRKQAGVEPVLNFYVKDSETGDFSYENGFKHLKPFTTGGAFKLYDIHTNPSRILAEYGIKEAFNKLKEQGYDGFWNTNPDVAKAFRNRVSLFDTPENRAKIDGNVKSSEDMPKEKSIGLKKVVDSKLPEIELSAEQKEVTEKWIELNKVKSNATKGKTLQNAVSVKSRDISNYLILPESAPIPEKMSSKTDKFEVDTLAKMNKIDSSIETEIPSAITSDKELVDTAMKGFYGKDWYEKSGNALASLKDNSIGKFTADIFTRLVGATGAGTAPRDNFAIAVKYYNRFAAGVYDNKNLKADITYLKDTGLLNKDGRYVISEDNIANAMEQNTLNTRKLGDYTESIRGNYENPPMDEWMNRLFSGLNGAPSDVGYDYQVGRTRYIAKILGIKPAAAQAALWVGYKNQVADFLDIQVAKAEKNPDIPKDDLNALRVAAGRMREGGDFGDVMRGFGLKAGDSLPEFPVAPVVAKYKEQLVKLLPKEKIPTLKVGETESIPKGTATAMFYDKNKGKMGELEIRIDRKAVNHSLEKYPEMAEDLANLYEAVYMVEKADIKPFSSFQMELGAVGEVIAKAAYLKKLGVDIKDESVKLTSANETTINDNISIGLLRKAKKEEEASDNRVIEKPEDKTFDRMLEVQRERHIRTSSFKNLFGDWENDPKNATKAVDADGKPSILHHGTTDDIETMSHDKIDTDSFGFHVGTKLQSHSLQFIGIRMGAENVIKNKPAGRSSFSPSEWEGGNIIPVFVDAKKPLVLKDEGSWGVSNIKGQILKKYGNEFSEADFEQADENYKKAANTLALLDPSGLAINHPVYKSITDLRRLEYMKILQSKGYDSIKYLNRFEGLTEKTEVGTQWIMPTEAESGLGDAAFQKKTNAEYSYILFEPNQLKSVIGNNGDFSKKPSMLKRVKNDEFYSQVERTVEEKMPKLASPEQVLGILKDAKKEEMDWLGLSDWLDSKKGQKVSKEEVTEFIRSNQVELKEVYKGADKRSPQEEKTYRDGQKDVNERYEAGKIDKNQRDEEYRKLDEKYPSIYKDAEPTKFGEYALEGGENYRELLLTMPQKESKLGDFDRLNFAKSVIKEGKDFDVAVSELTDLGMTKAQATESVQNLKSDSPDSRSSAMSFIDTVTGRIYRDQTAQETYKSSHWDEKNVLAHIRYDERTNLNGEKTFHLAEVQSDWHQDARKKGYKTKESDAQKELDILVKENGILRKELLETEDGSLEEASVMTKVDENAEKRRKLNSLMAEGVPDAPFKKSWHELAFKKALRLAVEKGMDAISWDTGETSADRYGLAKVVNNISYSKPNSLEGKTVNLGMIDGNNGIRLFVDSDGIVTEGKERGMDFVGKSLSDVIGKELSEKIMSDKSNNNISGDGLKLGGEGMKGFYDRILPQFAAKYVKKWGGVVESSKVNNFEEKFNFTLRGQEPNVGVNIFSRTEGRELELKYGFKTDKEAKDYANKFIADYPKGIFGDDVHTIKITPAMRESVMQGQPLFKKAQKKSDEDMVKDLTSLDTDSWYDLATEISKTKTLTGEETKRIDDMIAAGDLQGLQKYVGSLNRIGLLEFVSGFRRAGLLTAPATTMRNLSANSLYQVLEEISRIPASVFDIAVSTATGKDRAVQGFSPRALIAAATNAAKIGLPEAYSMIRNGEQRFNDENMKIAREATTGYRVLKPIEKMTAYTFRFMGAQDKVFHQFAFTRAKYEIAALKSKANKTDLKVELANLTDAETDSAFVAGQIAVFSNDNKFNTAYQKWRGNQAEAVKFLLDLKIPFAKTPSNIFDRILDYTGVWSLIKGANSPQGKELSKRLTIKDWSGFKKELSAAADDPETRKAVSMALSRGLVGTALMAYGYSLSQKGLLNGFQDDTDQEAKKIQEIEGSKSGSLKVGGMWHDISSLSPVAMLLLAGATAQRQKEKESMYLDEGKTSKARKALNITKILLQIAQQSPFIKAGADTFAEKHYGSPFDLENLIPLDSFIPSAVSAVAAAQDNVKRSTTAETGVGKIINKAKLRTPFLRQQLPEKTNVFGNPVEQPSVLSPFNSVSDKGNEVTREAKKLNYNIPLPKRKENEPLPEYNARKKESGSVVMDILKKTVEDSEYKSADKKEKRSILKSVGKIDQKDSIEDRTFNVKVTIVKEVYRPKIKEVIKKEGFNIPADKVDTFVNAMFSKMLSGKKKAREDSRDEMAEFKKNPKAYLTEYYEDYLDKQEDKKDREEDEGDN